MWEPAICIPRPADSNLRRSSQMVLPICAAMPHRIWGRTSLPNNLIAFITEQWGIPGKLSLI